MRHGKRWLILCYLVAAGTLLLALPWSSTWGTLAWSLPPSWARLFSHPASRGAVSGYGLLHFVVAWNMLLQRRGKP